MLDGGFNKKGHDNFGIETTLLERFKVFLNRKNQAISSRNQLRVTDAELRNASIGIRFTFGQSGPPLARVENFKRDTDTRRRSSARSVQDVC